MVHVIDLLGCIAQGPTTEEAVLATPEAIRSYLRFLQRHGESADPSAEIHTTISTHVMEGYWLASGDPVSGFEPDFQPLLVEDLKIYMTRLEWLLEEILEVLSEISLDQISVKPESGRSIFSIIEHIAEAQAYYLRYQVGRVDGLSEAKKGVHAGPDIAPAALADVWSIILSRLEVMSPTEREQSVPHGQVTWTARRALRRMLEHSWEHLLEIKSRIGLVV